jgi:hypothetical protein
LAGNAAEAIDIDSAPQASQVTIEFDGPKPHHGLQGFEHGVNLQVTGFLMRSGISRSLPSDRLQAIVPQKHHL